LYTQGKKKELDGKEGRTEKRIKQKKKKKWKNDRKN